MGDGQITILVETFGQTNGGTTYRRPSTTRAPRQCWYRLWATGADYAALMRDPSFRRAQDLMPPQYRTTCRTTDVDAPQPRVRSGNHHRAWRSFTTLCPGSPRTVRGAGGRKVRVRQLVVVGACTLALTACSAEKAEPEGITVTPTAATASPTPSPTPTSDEMTATDLSDPDGVGIVFVDTPDLTGPAASAHDAVAIYQKEYWRSLRTGTPSALLRPLISPSLQEQLDYSVARNRDNGWTLGGTLRVSISDVTVDEASATVVSCLDYSGVEFHKNGGPAQRYDEIGFVQHERSTLALSTLDDGTTWRPESETTEGDAC